MGTRGTFAWMNGTEHNKMCHRIWSTMHAPFLLPTSVCSHQWGGSGFGAANTAQPFSGMHLVQSRCKPADRESSDTAWQVYDFNQAGCILCGVMHICFDGLCPVQQNSEGYNICTITGMCVKELNFSAEEYIDTVCMSSLESLLLPPPPLLLPSAKPSTTAAAATARQPHHMLEKGQLLAHFSATSASKRKPSAQGPAEAMKARRLLAAPGSCDASTSASLEGGSSLLDMCRGRGILTSIVGANRSRCSVNKKNRYR